MHQPGSVKVRPEHVDVLQECCTMPSIECLNCQVFNTGANMETVTDILLLGKADHGQNGAKLANEPWLHYSIPIRTD